LHQEQGFRRTGAGKLIGSPGSGPQIERSGASGAAERPLVLQEVPSGGRPMSQESPSLPSGTLVEVRGERWRVVESIEHEGCATCRLVGTAASNLGIRRALLLPFDRPRPIVQVPRWRHVGRRRWVLGCRALLASDAGAAGLRGAADARLNLLDYQLEPALACARGALRLLLADEVGLGKTVQAGLILADLTARSELHRSLVLCPAGLCAQWQHELAHRFGLHAPVVDLPALRGMFRQVSADSVPWDRLPLAIVSVDFVKRPEVLQGMAHIRWDALVVDEAHLSALAPERAAAVNFLARRSRRVALLTATPHPGEEGAFEALCGVGQLAGEGPIVMFRRTRAGLGMPAGRRIRVLALRLSPAERALHRALHRYTARVWNARAGDGPGADARLAMIVLCKRAASGPAPLLASLERRLRWLDAAANLGACQLLLPLGEADAEAADDEPGAVLAAPGLPSLGDEVAILESLVDLARAALRFESKPRAITRLLRRVREPAIVFTEYRDALARLASQLPSGIEAAVIHGGLDRRERANAVRSFTDGHAPLLLATDAAAHGLNLQARCRLVINLDLPWNPVRLEQRIGRVDRIGQRKVVHAIHLVGRNTADAVVLERLAARTRQVRRSLGDDATDAVGIGAEAAIAGTVFGGALKPRRERAAPGDEAPGQASTPRLGGSADRFRSVDVACEARSEVERLTSLRRLRRQDSSLLLKVMAQIDTAWPWWTRLRFRGPGPPRLLTLFDADIVDARGLLLEQAVVALESGPVDLLASPRSVCLARLEAAALEAARARLAVVAAHLRPRLEAERAREAALAEVVESLPVVAVQAGLFDRRAERAADAVREQRARLQDETGRHVEHLRRAERIELAGTPRLVLAALVRGA
jgi:superfamily II DNA or RNA helicase